MKSKNAKKTILFLIIMILFIGIVNAASTDSNETISDESTTSITSENSVTHEKTTDYDLENNILNKNIEDESKESTDKNVTSIKLDNIPETQYTDSVTISGNLKDSNGKSLKDCTLNINLNGINYKTTTNNNGSFIYNTKANIIGQNNVTVTFSGNSYYTNTSKQTKYNVIQKETKLTLNDISNAEFSDDVVVSGRYTDSSGYRLRLTPLSIVVGSQRFSVKTDEDGYYNYTFKAAVVGVNNVTVSYHGNARYEAASVMKSFDVSRKPTVLTLNSIADAEFSDSVVVSGRYTDSSGYRLRLTPLSIVVGSQRFSVKTDGDGYYNYTFKAAVVGVNNVTVSYHGNARYEAASVMKSFDVSRKSTVLTLNSIADAEYGDSVVVSGRYTDSSGYRLRLTPLSIVVGSQHFTVKTDENGYYKYTLKTSTLGVNNVSVSYAGNARYKGYTVKSTFDVITPLNVIIDTPQKAKNASNMNIRVYVSFKDSSILKTINEGTVNVKINNQTLTSNVKYGKAIISYKSPSKVGNYTITANYIVNNHTYSSKKNIIITANQITSSESAILGNKDPKSELIALTNGVPNLVYMTNYVWADEDGTYTLTKSQIEEVFKQDSYSLYLNKYMSKYVAFKTLNESEIYHVLTREKWNVIEKAVNKVRVSSNKGTIPNNITVNLKGKSYTYGEARAIQSTGYTCGPTATSVCTQALRNYVNEYTLAVEFKTYTYTGTYASYIPGAMKKHNMTAEYIYKSSFDSALTKLSEGGCAIVFYGVNHYVSIIDINKDKTKVLVSNSYGNYSLGGGKIPNGWVSVSLMKQRFSSDSFAGLLIKLNYSLSSSKKTQVNNLYNNFGTKWARKNTNEELNL